MSHQKARVLSDKETVKALKGCYTLNDDDMAESFVAGKWIRDPKGAGYFTVRITGLVRSHQPEEEDIPFFVKELELEQPERFSDKLIKQTNRHAVIIKATPSGKKNVYGHDLSVSMPEDFHYLDDQTMHPLESEIRGTVDKLSIENILIEPPEESTTWDIRIQPIILLDYQMPMGANEKIWTQEMNTRDVHIGRDMTECSDGNYEALVVKHVEVIARPGLSLKPGEDVSAKKHFIEKVTYPMIAQVSYKNGNDKYLDLESKVDNDILKYVSGCRASDYYAPHSFEQIWMSGPRIHY